ncbi:MAG: hypothetical protein MJ170_03635 [Alphaproteobacteria bacterium]|nr:hypothetical protein [Alphaproteobacteria bacterium]
MESGFDAAALTAEHDRKNLQDIQRALDTGRIDKNTADYIGAMYTNGMEWFREVFHVLGKCLGAPKTAVLEYDTDSASGIDKPITISDICPMSAYLVQHRLDADPMRNQFFTSCTGHQIDLSVSSIVTVLVGAQKKVSRALDKVTGKYYTDYVNEVALTAQRVIESHERIASGKAIAEKIREQFDKKFITTASETVLAIIGKGHEKIAVDLVRALDKIRTPYARLQDVWRVKCLFDLVPQARTFIERIRDLMPDRVLEIRDKFYDMENPRNYRDAKLVINIGKDNKIIPMEIICQVRTFFDFERKTHTHYEVARKENSVKSGPIERKLADFMEDGIREYNLMIVRCLDDLFDRVGWNVLYSHDHDISMFDGFPKKCTLYYPQNILEIIADKLDNAIENEVFRMTTVPAKLTKDQEVEIFRFMTRFILVAAMPYLKSTWSVPSDTIAGQLFNFVMKEVQRYYKK